MLQPTTALSSAADGETWYIKAQYERLSAQTPNVHRRAKGAHLERCLRGPGSARTIEEVSGTALSMTCWQDAVDVAEFLGEDLALRAEAQREIGDVIFAHVAPGVARLGALDGGDQRALLGHLLGLALRDRGLLHTGTPERESIPHPTAQMQTANHTDVRRVHAWACAWARVLRAGGARHRLEDRHRREPNHRLSGGLPARGKWEPTFLAPGGLLGDRREGEGAHFNPGLLGDCFPVHGLALGLLRTSESLPLKCRLQISQMSGGHGRGPCALRSARSLQEHTPGGRAARAAHGSGRELLRAGCALRVGGTPASTDPTAWSRGACAPVEW